MSLFVIAQLVGCCGVVFSLMIFQLNKRNKMLRFGMTAGSFYTLHYFLLGAYTGAAMNLIGAIRTYIFYKMPTNKKHRWVLYLFIIIAAIATGITWHGPASLLAFGGITCGGIATWHRKPREVRRWFLLASPIWFTYSLVVGSYPGMVVEILMFSSNLIGEYRYDFHHPARMRRHLAKPA